MADPMYSTAEGEEDERPETEDFEDDQDPVDRAPEPGNAPAPGQRPSESGSTSPRVESDNEPELPTNRELQSPTGPPDAEDGSWLSGDDPDDPLRERAAERARRAVEPGKPRE